MFNERHRRCTAVQLMLSTDPSYDNRTIDSTLKMQIWIATNNRDVHRVMKTVSSYGYDLWCGFTSSHILEISLKVNTKVYLDVLKSVVIPWCNQVACGRPWVWQQDLAPVHKSKESQAWLQKECYNFVAFSHWPPPPTWTHWTTSFGHMSRTSPTWPPITPKPAWSPPSTEYLPSSRRRLWKRYALVPDPCRDGDWGWRWLLIIDVSSIT